MKRLISKKTAIYLLAWQRRHRLTVKQAAHEVRGSTRQFQRAIENNLVPAQLARICELIDENDKLRERIAELLDLRDEYQRAGTVTARDLANLAARPANMCARHGVVDCKRC